MENKLTYSAFEFFYDDSFEDYPSIAQVNIALTTVQVQGMGRPLRANWTPEHVNDLRNFHNIDAEQELIRILNEELNQALIRELMEINQPQNEI